MCVPFEQNVSGYIGREGGWERNPLTSLELH